MVYVLVCISVKHSCWRQPWPGTRETNPSWWAPTSEATSNGPIHWSVWAGGCGGEGRIFFSFLENIVFLCCVCISSVVSVKASMSFCVSPNHLCVNEPCPFPQLHQHKFNLSEIIVTIAPHNNTEILLVLHSCFHVCICFDLWVLGGNTDP